MGVNDARLERTGAAQSPGGIAGEGHGQRGPAVVRVTQRDDFRRPRVTARGQDGRLIRLGAAVCKEGFAQPAAGRDLGDAFGQCGLGLGSEDRGDVLQSVDLLVNPGIHFLVAMSDANGENAAEKVQILVAVSVVNILVFGARNHQRFLVVVEDGGEQKFLVCEKDLFFCHNADPSMLTKFEQTARRG